MDSEVTGGSRKYTNSSGFPQVYFFPVVPGVCLVLHLNLLSLEKSAVF